MAPVSAAERQRKRRERLKAAGEYNDYKAKNAEHSKVYRMKKASEFEALFKKEEKARILDEKRAKAKERQRKCREKKRSQLVVVTPGKSGYKSNQSLSRATNKIKKVLPMSPRKKKRGDKEPVKTVQYLKRRNDVS